MPRYLGLDWDHGRMYLLAASAGRGKVRLEQAVAWDEPHTLEPAALEEAGKRLAQRLKEAKVAPAPVLACVGRERVVFKEVRYPAVEDGQEPALVRFQAAKELTEPADRVVFDYARTGEPAGAGERRALVTVARREWVRALETVCRAAGLKLLTVTPRPFGVAASLAALQGTDAAAPAGAAVAVVAVARGWAEFTVARDGQVLFARPLPAGEALLGDVRRNLALFASQSGGGPGRGGVQALYFAGDDDQAALRERLQEMLAVPVHPLDPFADQVQVKVAGDRGGFAGAAGLARLWGRDEEAPVNLISPKQPRVETGSTRQRVVVGAGLAVLALLGAFFARTVMLDAKAAEVGQLRAELTELEEQYKQRLPVKEKVAALKEWDASAVPWLEELYNLTAHFPYEVGFRATQVNAAPLNQGGKDAAGMRLTVEGVVPRDKTFLVQELVDALNTEKHYRAAIESLRAQDAGGDEKTPVQEWVVRVDVTRQPLEHYTARVRLPEWLQQGPGPGRDRRR